MDKIKTLAPRGLGYQEGDDMYVCMGSEIGEGIQIPTWLR